MHICPLEFFWHAVSTENVERWTVFRSIKPNLICGDYAEWVEVSPASHENPTSSISPTKNGRTKRYLPLNGKCIHMILGFSNALHEILELTLGRLKVANKSTRSALVCGSIMINSPWYCSRQQSAGV